MAVATERASNFKRRANGSPADRGRELNASLEPRSLEELAEEQGVSAVFDLDQLTAAWPESDVFDDALDELLQDRIARREAHQRDTG